MSLFGIRRHAPLPAEGYLPDFTGATGWLNSEPLTPESLRGRVVLVDTLQFAMPSIHDGQEPWSSTRPNHASHRVKGNSDKQA